jgi:predicted GNAT family acetyltransferase
MPEWAGVAQDIFGEPCSLFGMPNAIGYVAYVDDEPASAAMVLVVGSVAGIDWVSTRHAYRGRGLGEAVTRASVNAGFELGARIAALQAEPKAESLYRRVGFISVSSYRWYACPSAG